MSKILSQNPIRFNIDTLKTDSHALIVMKPGNFLDCTNATQVTGFNLTYSQPANTQIKFLFSTGDTVERAQLSETGGSLSQNTANGSWFKLKSTGYAQIVEPQSLTHESIIEEGNSISELLALSSIPAFVGYKVRVAIALLSSDSNSVPAVKLSLKAKNTTQQVTKIEYSPLYELGENAQIVNIVASSQTASGGSVAIYGDINESDNWQLINNLVGKNAQTLQLRATLTAPQINSSSAILNNVKIIYSSGSGVVSGEGTCEIVSKTHNWYKPVKHCRCVVKHAPFIESSMKVYASFRALPSMCENETLGTGDGKLHTYQLNNPSGINLESVKVYYDNQQIFSGYEVNCEVGRVTCTPPAGVLVTCDYEFGWTSENWQELNFMQLTRKPDYDESEYYLRVDQAGYICAVKIELHTKTGYTTGESIGKGTGQATTYKLAHIVREGNITILANNSQLDAKNFSILDDGQFIKIAATNGATLKANYSWISECPIIYEFHSVFSE